MSTAVKHLHESGQPPKELSSETQHQKMWKKYTNEIRTIPVKQSYLLIIFNRCNNLGSVPLKQLGVCLSKIKRKNKKVYR